ncbi:MAG: NAD(P)/FAD-dependent oxidoreductase [Kiritimatiellae bacterium]|nr:NAD(P)/FAD-dependent oxidoreductase [Kiritimatiellia bacterium]
MKYAKALTHRPVPLAIIGGGAAGLFAAAIASSRGLGCLVLERKARVGSKLLMTANGRCNFTKDIPPERMLADIGEPVASFVGPAIRSCPPSMIAGGFKARGLGIRRMPDGRLFPASGKAADVVHVFGDQLRDSTVPLLTNCPVTGVQPVKNGFILATRHFTLWARNVLVATGGASFPKTGSVGDGQEFARRMGHRVEPLRAGLVGCETDDRAVRAMAGARFENGASAALVVDGREVFRARGEVEVEQWGVSGAAVYNCTRHAVRQGIEVFDLRIETPEGNWTVKRPTMRPLKEAIVTMGGVSLEEVNPETMESRIVPGLYFAGEVLDVDGPTGGYNITIAFATANLAVRNCAQRSGPDGRPDTFMV